MLNLIMQISAEFQEEKIKNKLNKKLSAKKIVWKEKELNKKHILSLTKKFKLIQLSLNY